jgi:hypothetical protein
MRIIVGLLLLALPLFALALIAGCGVGPKKGPAVAPAVAVNNNDEEKNAETTAVAQPKTTAVKEEKKKAKETKAVEKKPAEPWGTLKGRVVWAGDKIPDPGFVTVPPAHPDGPFCTAQGKIKIPEDNTVVVDKTSKGVKDVFIWLVAKTKDGKPPIHPSLQASPPAPVVIDQPICMFIPHALALREGQALLVKNSAPISHNFKYGGHPDVNPGGNQIIESGKTWNITDLKADRFPIAAECNLHPWMKAWIRVFDHPYFAVTDSQGKFEIKLAPAGSYQLMGWHSTGWLGGAKGRAGTTVAIPDGGMDLGDIPFPPPAP